MTYKFITDPSVGMWSRAKRTGKGGKLDAAVWARTEVDSGSEMSEVESEDEVKMGMDEAVERGYGSDRDAIKGKKE